MDEIELRPVGRWYSEHLGVVGDPHQINVALTRAKFGLVIIGKKTLNVSGSI